MRKTLTLALSFAAAIAVSWYSQPARASIPQPDDCKAWGVLAGVIAADRDKGTPLEEVKAKVAKTLDECVARGESCPIRDREDRERAERIPELAFMSKLSPQDIAQNVYASCKSHAVPSTSM